MPFNIIRNDITQMNVDAIVNAANNRLLAGGGVCGAIFRAAGAEKLQKECQRIGYVDTGAAVITKGYALSAKYIIHTAGPVWQGGHNNEEELLYSSYMSSLQLARKHRLKSIAFPLISAGIYGYPKNDALHVAVRAIGDFLVEHEMDVSLVVYDKETFKLSGKLYDTIVAYIDDNYVDANFVNRCSDAMVSEAFALDATITLLQDEEKNFSDTMPLPSAPPSFSMPASPIEFDSTKEDDSRNKRFAKVEKLKETSLESVLRNLDESFSQSLIRLIDEKGMTDVDTYKKANIDRKLFSKIKNNVNYKPKKTTAIAFAIALELSLAETNALLNKAGYILSHSSKFDVIIEFFIENKNYNIMEINEALFAFDQMLLGC